MVAGIDAPCRHPAHGVLAYTVMKQLLLLTFIAFASEAMAQENAECVRERAAMVDTIRVYARSEAGVLGPQGISERVLDVVGQTQRHRFIPGGSCSAAYKDAPVLIGHGQTISQPYVVALMTHLAAVKLDDTVLEVGTGSGYQAAVLARLVRKVCTVEIIPPLAEAAALRRHTHTELMTVNLLRTPSLATMVRIYPPSPYRVFGDEA